jgi:Flp pilus assembly CpaF family ATPase
MPLSVSERERLVNDVQHELFGLGPLEPLLEDPTISDILVTNTTRSTSSDAARSNAPTSLSKTTST